MGTQVSYSLAGTPITQPLQHLLNSKEPSEWSKKPENNFEGETDQQCTLEAQMFNPNPPTCLATNWLKLWLGYRLY